MTQIFCKTLEQFEHGKEINAKLAFIGIQSGGAHSLANLSSALLSGNDPGKVSRYSDQDGHFISMPLSERHRIQREKFKTFIEDSREVKVFSSRFIFPVNHKYIAEKLLQNDFMVYFVEPKSLELSKLLWSYLHDNQKRFTVPSDQPYMVSSSEISKTISSPQTERLFDLRTQSQRSFISGVQSFGGSVQSISSETSLAIEQRWSDVNFSHVWREIVPHC